MAQDVVVSASGTAVREPSLRGPSEQGTAGGVQADPGPASPHLAVEPTDAVPEHAVDLTFVVRALREAVSDGLRDVLPQAVPTPQVRPLGVKPLGSGHYWSAAYTGALIVFIAVLVGGTLFGPGWLTVGSSRIIAWVMAGLLLFAFGMIAGRGVTGTYKGLWVDQRYEMSLSQFQLIAWTFVVLSAYVVVVMWRVQASNPDPLGVALPPELWALLGISTASFVGSSLIKQSKTGKQADQQDLDQLRRDPTLSQQPIGQLATRDDPTNASFADMFTGDEVGNALTMDASKLQMFFFTIVVVVGYALALAKVFSSVTPPDAFPDVNLSIVSLLLVSHAGYLAYKATPHSLTPTPTTP